MTSTGGATPEVKVILPHQLRQRFGARSEVVPADTVRDMLHALEESHPGFLFSICYETGELRPFVNVFVGSENVRYLDGLETALHPDDVVHIIHSVAGGEDRIGTTPEKN